MLAAYESHGLSQVKLGQHEVTSMLSRVETVWLKLCVLLGRKVTDPDDPSECGTV